MENVDKYINLAGFIGLLTYIIWQDYRDGRNFFKKNVSNNDISASQGELRHHFNGTTTALLIEIKALCVDVKEALTDISRNGVRIRK